MKINQLVCKQIVGKEMFYSYREGEIFICGFYKW